MKKKTTKTTARKTIKKKTTLDRAFTEDASPIISEPFSDSMPFSQPSEQKKSRIPLLVVIVLVLGALTVFAVNRGLLFAAIVNGKPILRWNLDSVLVQRYGQQTLDGMVTEQLIGEEAQKAGVVVTQADIDGRAKEILNSFGSNVTIDDFLKLQGMQKNDFDNQIKLQLVVQRILSKGLSLTDADIDDYIASNRAQLTATDPAQLKEEAKKAILDQKVAEKFDAWLQDLRKKASIHSFL